MSRCRNVAAAILVVMTGSTASAQDQCSDILRDGTLQKINWREKSYFNELVYARFASLSYEEAKTDRTLTGSVPIADFVLGGSHSDQSFRQKRQDIENTYFRNATSGRELSVVLSKGDPEIVRAWSQCMGSKGGGLAMQPRVIGPRQVRIDVLYFLKGNEHTVKLTDDVLITNADALANEEFVSVLQGSSCLKKGAEFRAGDPPCIVTLRVASAMHPLSVTARSSNSAAEIYVPPRVAMKEETASFEQLQSCATPERVGHPGWPERARAWRATCKHGLLGDILRGTENPTNTVVMPDDMRNAGWRFIASSAHLQISEIYGQNHRGNQCSANEPKVTDTSFQYSMKVFSGSNANASMVCVGLPSIMMRRVVVQELGALPGG